MSIKIRVEKLLSKGDKVYQILEISGILPYDQLPNKYLEQNYRKVIRDDFHPTGQIIFYSESSRYEWREGETIGEKRFLRGLAIIKEAVQELYEINKEIAEIAKYWHGEETFII